MTDISKLIKQSLICTEKDDTLSEKERVIHRELFKGLRFAYAESIKNKIDKISTYIFDYVTVIFLVISVKLTKK